MLNFPNLKGFSVSDGSVVMPLNMSEALSLVREGRLQDASDLLMGHGTNDVVFEKVTSRVQPQQNVVTSDLAARGLASVREMLSKLDLRSGKARITPDWDAGVHTTSGYRSASDVPSASGPGRFERVAFSHHGASHPYYLYTPTTAAPPSGRPLVMMLHGCTQDAQDFSRGTRMNATAEASGALVLYPTQNQSANANGCWNWFRPEDQRAGAGEPALLRAMLKHANEAQAVDTQHVYVAGLSAGGAMAAVLAQQYPSVFAAVGVHSGLAPGAATTMMGALSAMKSGAKGWQVPIANDRFQAVPMIVMHGDADNTVHQRNAEQLLQSGLAGLPTTVQTQEQGVSRDGQRYTRTCVVDSAASSQVVAEHWLLHGAGHAWSGGDARGSHASARGVDASAEMLRFFLAQPPKSV